MVPTNVYQLWGEDVSSGYCILGYIEGYEDDWKLTNATSVLSEWPDDVTLRMDPDFKRQIKLSDHLGNPARVIIASLALRQFLEGRGVPYLEFLPIRIYNHKRKVASEEYTLLNLLGIQDCMDMDASGVTWNSILPEYIAEVDHIVLDEDRVEEGVVLFRAKHFAEAIFVKRDLADAILADELTGVEFLELEDWE